MEATPRGPMKALLVQPPIYDTQYYAEWSMPSGLLKVSTWLRGLGYDLRLVDCLYPNATGHVKHEIRKGVQVCSTTEWTLSDYRQLVKQRTGKTTIELPAHHRYKFEFGMPLHAVEALLGTSEQPMFFEEERWVPD